LENGLSSFYSDIALMSAVFPNPGVPKFFSEAWIKENVENGVKQFERYIETE